MIPTQCEAIIMTTMRFFVCITQHQSQHGTGSRHTCCAWKAASHSGLEYGLGKKKPSCGENSRVLSAARRLIIAIGLLAESDVDSNTRSADAGGSESVGAFSRSSMTPPEVHAAINCVGSCLLQVCCPPSASDNPVSCLSNSSFSSLYRLCFS